MKALKSPLAKAVLADPKGRNKLRTFLATKSTVQDDARPATVIEVKTSEGQTVRVRPTVVPKAA